MSPHSPFTHPPRPPLLLSFTLSLLLSPSPPIYPNTTSLPFPLSSPHPLLPLPLSLPPHPPPSPVPNVHFPITDSLEYQRVLSPVKDHGQPPAHLPGHSHGNWLHKSLGLYQSIKPHHFALHEVEIPLRHGPDPTMLSGGSRGHEHVQEVDVRCLILGHFKQSDLSVSLGYKQPA